jgi:hypothetical protein
VLDGLIEAYRQAASFGPCKISRRIRCDASVEGIRQIRIDRRNRKTMIGIMQSRSQAADEAYSNHGVRRWSPIDMCNQR